MKFMGHADLQIVNRYVKDEAVARLNDFLRPGADPRRRRSADVRGARRPLGR
jgi:hypothetical protein